MTRELAAILALLFFGLVVLVVYSLCKAAKDADQLEPFAVVTHNPEPTPEDLEIPTFLRYQGDDLPRPRKERE